MVHDEYRCVGCFVSSCGWTPSTPSPFTMSSLSESKSSANIMVRWFGGAKYVGRGAQGAVIKVSQCCFKTINRAHCTRL